MSEKLTHAARTLQYNELREKATRETSALQMQLDQAQRTLESAKDSLQRYAHENPEILEDL